MDFTEVSNVCASCRVIEKQFLNLSAGDLNSMSMLTEILSIPTLSQGYPVKAVPVAPLTGFFIVTLH